MKSRMEGMFKLWYKGLLKSIQEYKGNGSDRKEKEGHLMLQGYMTVMEKWKHICMGKTTFLEHKHV